MSSFFSFFILYGVFQGLVIILAFLLKNKTESLSKKLLIALILICSGYLVFEYVVIFKRYLVRFPHLIGVYLPVLFTIPSLLYLLIKSELYNWVKFKSKLLIHFLPSLLIVLSMIPYYRMSSHEKLKLFQNHSEALQLYPHAKLFASSLLLISFFYAIKSLLLFRNRKFNHKKNKWLKNYVLLFLILLIGVIIFEIVVVLNHIHSNELMLIPLLAFSFIIHFIGYTMISHSAILNGNTKKEMKNLPEEKRSLLKKKIHEILIVEKTFTNSNLTSDYFCKRLDINKNYFSSFINNEFDCSFTSLINTYRVNEAKIILSSNKLDHLNFSGIANIVGFNNKNSFTRVFKRHTGITPSQFRINHKA